MDNCPRVIIYPPEELSHSSYIHTGLFELEQRSLLKCKIKFDLNKRLGRISTQNGNPVFTLHHQKKTSFYKLIDGATNREINFAVDLDDVPYFFSQVALNKCDFIFKRTYETRYIEPLDDRLKAKIRPLGLAFMVRSCNAHSKPKMFLGFTINSIQSVLKKNRNTPKRISQTLKNSYRQWTGVNNTRTWDDFEAYPREMEPKAFYIKRLFPNINDPDTVEIHEQRANLVRLLRKKLNGKFIGGLKPDEISKKYYPDCLTDLPTNPHDFLKQVQKAAIGVYTRGLKNSPGWTLPEFLSQGKCIIAEPLTTELPMPLEDGKHLMYFHSEEECADLCEMLLNNPDKMEELSKNARAYYEKHVDPVANIHRILQFMLESKNNS